MSIALKLFALCLVTALAACTFSRPHSVSQISQDRGPDRDIDVSNIPNAVPRNDPVTAAGNKSPYTVLGKTYHINFNTENFQQTGYASWYGKKFHGRFTSNGERYDMFAMTAAHKTLPIPCYVKVTNLENGKEVVVRVNDRGPFHEGRIIDLSYSAAKKLDVHTKGTAKVKIQLINTAEPTKTKAVVTTAPASVKPSPPRPVANASAPSSSEVASAPLAVGTFLQVGAFSKKRSADHMQNKVATLTGYNTLVQLESQSNLHKVLVGPIKDNFDLLILKRVILDANLPEPHVVEL